MGRKGASCQSLPLAEKGLVPFAGLMHAHGEMPDALRVGIMCVEDADPARPEAEPEPAAVDLSAMVSGIEEQLARFHERAAHRELVIDRLHVENQRLRSGLSRAILDPVVTDLIRLHDQLSSEARRQAAGGQAARLVRSYADEVAEVLERCRIDSFSADPGEPFDHTRHQALGVLACQDESKNNTVAEVLAAGFIDRETGRVRRPVQARFYRFVPGSTDDHLAHDHATPQ